MRGIFKHSFLIFALCLTLCTVWAQSPVKDSLLRVLNSKIPDTSRVITLTKLSTYSFATNPDTAVQLGNEALALSRRIGDEKGEARSLYAVGSVYYMVGNYATALSYYAQSLQLSEKINDLTATGKAVGGIGLIYASQGNFLASLKYFHEGLRRMDQINDKQNRCIISGNLASAFLHLKMYDSASLYAQQNYQLALELKDRQLIGLALGMQAAINLERFEYALALDYLRPSIDYLEKSQTWSGLSGSYFGMASVFRKLGNVDSAILYARKALATARQHGFSSEEQEAAELLSQVYRGVNADSAYRYADLAKAAKDSLYSQQKQQQIQALNFEEKMRENEKTLLAAQEAENHKRNLQYAGISLFLLTLLIAFLVLGHMVIVGPRVIKFLGVILLLIVFEFINLLLHPWLERVTHHSPILMLISLVLIAILIVPLHHRLEHWIVGRLVEKNQRIRQDIAKKIIGEKEVSKTTVGDI